FSRLTHQTPKAAIAWQQKHVPGEKPRPRTARVGANPFRSIAHRHSPPPRAASGSTSGTTHWKSRLGGRGESFRSCVALPVPVTSTFWQAPEKTDRGPFSPKG